MRLISAGSPQRLEQTHSNSIVCSPFISSEVHNTFSFPPCGSLSKIVLDLWGPSILRPKETGTVICSVFWALFLDVINSECGIADIPGGPAPAPPGPVLSGSLSSSLLCLLPLSLHSLWCPLTLLDSLSPFPQFAKRANWGEGAEDWKTKQNKNPAEDRAEVSHLLWEMEAASPGQQLGEFS